MIHILEDYYMSVDSKNYTLCRKKGINKTGDPVIKVLGYYGTLEKALVALVKYATNKKLENISEDIDLKEAIKIYRNENKKLISILKEALPEINDEVFGIGNNVEDKVGVRSTRKI